MSKFRKLLEAEIQEHIVDNEREGCDVEPYDIFVTIPANLVARYFTQDETTTECLEALGIDATAFMDQVRDAIYEFAENHFRKTPFFPAKDDTDAILDAG